MEEGGGQKKPWWKFWARKAKTTGGEEGFEIPDDVGRSQYPPVPRVLLIDSHPVA